LRLLQSVRQRLIFEAEGLTYFAFRRPKWYARPVTLWNLALI
jgi:hypothetical protein